MPFGTYLMVNFNLLKLGVFRPQNHHHLFRQCSKKFLDLFKPNTLRNDNLIRPFHVWKPDLDVLSSEDFNAFIHLNRQEVTNELTEFSCLNWLSPVGQTAIGEKGVVGACVISNKFQFHNDLLIALWQS